MSGTFISPCFGKGFAVQHSRVFIYFEMIDCFVLSNLPILHLPSWQMAQLNGIFACCEIGIMASDVHSFMECNIAIVRKAQMRKTFANT